METGLYVAISGQMALQRRLDTIANNVANASTVGFRAEQVRFESLISQATNDPVAFASAGETYLSTKSGALTQTGNPLDVAVQGEAWMSINTAAGQAYTRDGRMQVNANGDLLSVNGDPILDIGGAPIVINPQGGAVQIAKDGMISQGGQQVGAIGLFSLPPEAKLMRIENIGVTSDLPAEPVLEFSSNGIVQGYVESSNVNPVLEMTQLISVTRAFENIAASINRSEDVLSEAVRTLGDPR